MEVVRKERNGGSERKKERNGVSEIKKEMVVMK